MAETPEKTEPTKHPTSPGKRASMEDDLDEIINSCFSNSPALNMKPMPTPPALTLTPPSSALGDDDDQFMAWLNEDKPLVITGSSSKPDTSHTKTVEQKLDKVFEDASDKSESAHATPAPPVQPSAAASHKETIPNNSEPTTEPSSTGSFLTGLTEKLGSLKLEGFHLLDQARDKAVVLAETGRQLAVQKYSEFIEVKNSGAGSSSAPAGTPANGGSAFVIDDEDDIAGLTVQATGEEHQHREQEEDPNKINVSRTELEKAYALAMHALSGLTVGDSIVISKETLPGATLFPCIMYVPSKTTTKMTEVSTPEESSSNQLKHEGNEPVVVADETEDAGMPEHRFLVVTKERFLVIDTHGGKVGSTGTVSINKHLTELQKMTFKKKSPEVVNLFFHSPVSDYQKETSSDANDMHYKRVFRISKRDLFVQTLQKNMMRFK